MSHTSAPADQSISDTGVMRMDERLQKLLLVHRLRQALAKAERDVETSNSSDAPGFPR